MPRWWRKGFGASGLEAKAALNQAVRARRRQPWAVELASRHGAEYLAYARNPRGSSAGKMTGNTRRYGANPGWDRWSPSQAFDVALAGCAWRQIGADTWADLLSGVRCSASMPWDLERKWPIVRDSRPDSVHQLLHAPVSNYCDMPKSKKFGAAGRKCG